MNDILDYCNEARKTLLGLPPVDAMRGGHRSRSGDCPVANTVNEGNAGPRLIVGAQSFYVRHRGYGCGCSVCNATNMVTVREHPAWVTTWIQRFDGCQMPELELAPMPFGPFTLVSTTLVSTKEKTMLVPELTETLAADREAALEWGNALRAEWMLPPLEELPDGKRCNPTECVLGELLDNRYTFNAGPQAHRYTGAENYPCKGHLVAELPMGLDLPEPVQRFETAFEAGLHPDLVKA